MRHPLLVWLCAIWIPSQALASYITDALEVPVRSGDSQEYRILRFLPAGSDITVIESRASGYSKIQDANGQEGFVLTRYVMDAEPAQNRLRAVEQSLRAAEQTVSELRTELTRLEAALEQQTSQISQSEARAQASEAALAQLAGDDALSLRDRLLALETERQVLLSDNERLKAERLIAKDDSAKTWFGIGALTLGIGILMGFVLPRLRRTRTSSGL